MKHERWKKSAKQEEYILARTPIVTAFLTELVDSKPYWPAIYHRFKTTDTTNTTHSDLPRLMASLGEVALSFVSQQIADQYYPRVIAHPIVTNVQTAQYKFETNQLGQLLTVQKRRLNQTHCEFDAVFYCDGKPEFPEVPLLIELKLQQKNSPFNSIDEVLSNYVVRKRAEPVQEYFKADKISYAVMMFTECVDEDNPAQIDFLRRGGYIVPFWHEPLEYKKIVRRLMGR